MTDMIEIQPTRAQRRAFAAWAVAQVPKIRTVGINTFAVPAGLFTEAPEEILIGSLVDGHRYVSPDGDTAEKPRLLDCGLCYEEDGEEVHPHPECTVGRPELVGVASADGFREAVPGEPLPEVPAEAYGPDSTPLPDASEHSDSSNSAAEPPEGVFPCDGCDREFTTARGRDTHNRQAHGPQGR
ncbi:hypothetical protein [Streptomyces murinus]|uniref:hypothetical protein n=1 Tax=Streptomyces murinus TaxID=33900 RepID=UPI0018F6745B|nr:hypothetical protein [Streptomyces murinus]